MSGKKGRSGAPGQTRKGGPGRPARHIRVALGPEHIGKIRALAAVARQEPEVFAGRLLREAIAERWTEYDASVESAQEVLEDGATE